MKINEIILKENDHEATRKLVERALYVSYTNTIEGLDEVIKLKRNRIITLNFSDAEFIDNEVEEILSIFNATMNTYIKFHTDVNTINDPDVKETLIKIENMRKEINDKVNTIPKISIKFKAKK